MGVYFEREEPLICIGFCNRDNWGYPVYKLLVKSNYNNEGKYTTSPYEEEGGYWFDFKCNEQFNSLDLPKQITLLRSFFEEVMNIIYELKNIK